MACQISRLEAAEGGERRRVLGAGDAEPEGDPKGAVVVIQEIFGVNVHIRDVADRLAAEGYLAIA
ncbi:MAG: dienelactone hydrolase family protein, partial [Vicinamibacterales bacterium]|nr:dienelactone hydrolase family protein [Vicinamibacterales bacterium]